MVDCKVGSTVTEGGELVVKTSEVVKISEVVTEVVSTVEDVFRNGGNSEELVVIEVKLLDEIVVDEVTVSDVLSAVVVDSIVDTVTLLEVAVLDSDEMVVVTRSTI